LGFRGGSWKSYVGSIDEKPKVTRRLLKRVLSYARPYSWKIAVMLVLILTTTGLQLLSPLVLRNLIDVVLPAKDINRLIWLGLALLAIPAAARSTSSSAA
jgi:ATP-binding cassette subfamily B protein